MVMAMVDSVTVSIGELTNGALSDSLRVRGDIVSTSEASKSMYPGSSKKSLYCGVEREAHAQKTTYSMRIDTQISHSTATSAPPQVCTNSYAHANRDGGQARVCVSYSLGHHLGAVVLLDILIVHSFRLARRKTHGKCWCGVPTCMSSPSRNP